MLYNIYNKMIKYLNYVLYCILCWREIFIIVKFCIYYEFEGIDEIFVLEWFIF